MKRPLREKGKLRLDLVPSAAMAETAIALHQIDRPPALPKARKRQP